MTAAPVRMLGHSIMILTLRIPFTEILEPLACYQTNGTNRLLACW